MKHLLYIAEVLCVCMCVACWFQAEGEEWQSEGTSSVSCLLVHVHDSIKLYVRMSATVLLISAL